MRHAVAGNGWSPVTVAQTTRSSSSGAILASSRAWRAAASANELVTCSGAAMRRSRMPVRWTIHSSDVSTIFSRSKLVSRRSGT
jgi:hypothetical protein